MAPALQATTAMLARRQLTTTAARVLLPVQQRQQQQQLRGYATPNGPPPANFRTSRPVKWTWDQETTLDRLGKYFLMTEMARGMYVLLEQYFRPPYVEALEEEAAWLHSVMLTVAKLHHLLPLREGMPDVLDC